MLLRNANASLKINIASCFTHYIPYIAPNYITIFPKQANRNHPHTLKPIHPFVYHPCHWLAFELAHSLWFEMGATGAQAKDSSTVHIPSQTSFWVWSVILYYSAPQLHSNLLYPHCQYEPIYPCTFFYHHNINTQSITVFISKFLQHWESLINSTHTMGKCFA